jgi:Flp pilus assembly protein TadD
VPEPSSAAAVLELGNSLLQAGRLAEAAATYERALALEPDNARIHNNLAVAWAEQRSFERAVAGYRRALQLDAGYAEAHYNLGNALRELARPEDALVSYDRACALRPDWPAAHCNRGLALAARGHEALAEAAYRRALALRPDYAEAHNNLGLCLELQGRLEEAMAQFDRALDLVPDFASAHANRAQLRLLQGDFRAGWAEYEWRWRLPGVSLAPVAVPRWDGTPLAGRTILVRAEQGFGDTVQFIRLAPLLKDAGARVVLECQPTLARLLASAPGIDAVVARGAELPRCDVQIPLASLPNAVGLFDLASLPPRVPYLFAQPERVERWRNALAPSEGFKVGIVWKGNPRHPQDSHRSIPFERMAALATVPGVELFGLQVGERAPEAPWLRDLTGGPEQPPLEFEETAAIVANLDLVVSCDTAMVHLAGALGRPVWIALPRVPDFRWLLDREDSPWYPTARLFRQTSLDDWEELFARIAAALARHAGSA